jgi:hypothetical protein
MDNEENYERIVVVECLKIHLNVCVPYIYGVTLNKTKTSDDDLFCYYGFHNIINFYI